MFLQQLHIINFKNHTKKTFDFKENVIGFTGLNGKGKTNILDAIYMTGFTKSYFSSTDKQCIQHDEDFFRIVAIYRKGEKLYEVVLALQCGKKKIVEVNGSAYQKFSEHIGQFPVVIVAPDDSVLILGGSEERRRFMDPIISQVNQKYLLELSKYQKVLAQRNALLKNKSQGNADRSLLEVYDAQLVPSAEYIYEQRKAFIEKIIPFFQESFRAISGNKDAYSMQYNSQLSESNLAELLLLNKQKDEITQRTNAGIHKDDIAFELDGRKVKQFGSQGQQKTFLLALKLAQYHFLKEELELAPLFLIDDMFDKLDTERGAMAVKYIRSNLNQVFITHTNADTLKEAIGKDGLQMEIIE